MGKLRSTSETVALKITERFESESSERFHQMNENKFMEEEHLLHMAQVYLSVYSEEKSSPMKIIVSLSWNFILGMLLI
jgi:hypothetical protein